MKKVNLFVFLLIWAFLWYIPIPPRKFRLASPTRLASLVFGLFIFFIAQLIRTPLSIFIYVLLFTRAFVALFESAFLIKQAKEKVATEYAYSYRRVPLNFSTKISVRIIAALFLIYFLSVSLFVVFGQVQRVANATYFNTFITVGPGLPFNMEIPDNMVRLVTKELAISIARRHMSEFGSNMRVLDCHITKSPEGKLVWVTAIGSTNVLAENYVKGFVIVDATDPLATPKILRTEFFVGEKLWWDHNIQFRSYMVNIAQNYGVAYVTWDSATNETMYVLTRYNIGFDLIRKYEAPIVYDSEGNVKYDLNSLQTLPTWITQVYDEDWLEEMINEMGLLQKRREV